MTCCTFRYSKFECEKYLKGSKHNVFPMKGIVGMEKNLRHFETLFYTIKLDLNNFKFKFVFLAISRIKGSI